MVFLDRLWKKGSEDPDPQPVIQSFWEGTRLPEVTLLSIRSYLRHGFTYHLYSYEQIENVPPGAVIMDAREILPENLRFRYKNGSLAAFSNLFRFMLLYKRGGIWTDHDLICLKPFRFDQDYVFASEVDTDYQRVYTMGFFLQAKAGSKPYKFAVAESLRLRNQVISGELEWQVKF